MKFIHNSSIIINLLITIIHFKHCLSFDDGMWHPEKFTVGFDAKGLPISSLAPTTSALSVSAIVPASTPTLITEPAKQVNSANVPQSTLQASENSASKVIPSTPAPVVSNASNTIISKVNSINASTPVEANTTQATNFPKVEEGKGDAVASTSASPASSQPTVNYTPPLESPQASPTQPKEETAQPTSAQPTSVEVKNETTQSPPPEVKNETTQSLPPEIKSEAGQPTSAEVKSEVIQPTSTEVKSEVTQPTSTEVKSEVTQPTSTEVKSEVTQPTTIEHKKEPSSITQTLPPPTLSSESSPPPSDKAEPPLKPVPNSPEFKSSDAKPNPELMSEGKVE